MKKSSSKQHQTHHRTPQDASFSTVAGAAASSQSHVFAANNHHHHPAATPAAGADDGEDGAAMVMLRPPSLHRKSGGGANSVAGGRPPHPHQHHHQPPQHQQQQQVVAQQQQQLHRSPPQKAAPVRVAQRQPSPPWPCRDRSGGARRGCFCTPTILRAMAALSLAALVFGLLAAGATTYWRHERTRKSIDDEQQYMRRLIEQVNAAPKARWKAKFNPFGHRAHDYNFKTLRNVTAVKEYVEHIRRFFNSDKMTEHISIQTNGTFRSDLSPQDVIECCAACGNCLTGGDPLKALTYWAIEGIVTGGADGCKPYTIDTKCGIPCTPDTYEASEKQRQCHRECQSNYYRNSYSSDKTKGTLAYTLFPRRMTVDQAGKERVMMPSIIGHLNETAAKPLTSDQIRNIIRKELYLFGPTTFALPVTEEFLHYETGVYHPFPEEDFEKRIIYWHVVKLIGWQHDERDRFHWVAVNSWGEQWGENGQFRVDASKLERFGLEYETGLFV